MLKSLKHFKLIIIKEITAEEIHTINERISETIPKYNFETNIKES